ncbi:hypothetical protein BPAE_0255g00040 [Botrytis paeoniae]|uniref:Uncharacterized protein n=1 Tax=Botrytis paeoniae TaxID=278948 RepID=A0A4Z1F989_9HELO|nr:hypothetical protein BPAE_0255g00040 [Botrytis paeoniae]
MPTCSFNVDEFMDRGFEKKDDEISVRYLSRKGRDEKEKGGKKEKEWKEARDRVGKERKSEFLRKRKKAKEVDTPPDPVYSSVSPTTSQHYKYDLQNTSPDPLSPHLPLSGATHSNSQPPLRLQRCLELRNHFIFFLTHVAFELRIGHRIVVFAFETADHAAEILPHEFREQLRTGVAVADTAGFENFIGEIGTSFEGEGFGEDKRVVAVEEEGGYLVGY